MDKRVSQVIRVNPSMWKDWDQEKQMLRTDLKENENNPSNVKVRDIYKAIVTSN